jgi:hypothetical protein
MGDLPGKDDPVGWWYLLRDRYAEIRRPHWREPLPSKTEVQSQKRLWALYFASTFAREHRGDTASGLDAFLRSFCRWAATLEGDARTTVWGLLTRFSEGDGSLVSATPEASIRAALRSVPRDVALRLVLRLAAELAEGVPRR